MYNLDQAISEWRQRMAAGGLKSASVLDELESHLREEFRAQVSKGASECRAFESAVAQIGSAGSLRAEFNKVSGATCLPVVIGTCLWSVLTLLCVVLISGKLLGGKMGLLLFMHFVTLTTGYLAVFMTGAFAICYVGLQWSGQLLPATQKSLERATVHFTRISAALVVIGFFLGVVWCGQNRGTYWTGSPREVGTLMVMIWLLAAWAVQRFSGMNMCVRMFVCILGNVVVAAGWFGAGILEADPGLHHFARYWLLPIFVGAHLLLLAMGFSRRFETAKS